jgi:S-adenosylmethionine:tRNA ribosyltransferase-isomerase
MKKSDFIYALPTELIAQTPLPERQASRMLCLDRNSGALTDRQFSDFISLLNERDLLVFNDTRVMPARLFGNKTTGGKIEILIERVLSDRQALAHVRASKAPKSGTLLHLDQGFECQVLGRENDLFILAFNGNLMQIMERIGHIPLPPYIARADQDADKTRYQTVFAKATGAVAAPTAGLHFDLPLLEKIKLKGIATAFVTLHVGSGTFQPVRTENLSEHIMHQEYFSVPPVTAEAVRQTRDQGGRVIAIGTTAVRSLESASKSGQIEAASGETDLFITPGYAFKSVDALLTNFHLPESTLLMLVSAFASHGGIMNAYQHAIRQRYRFFSYGDAMFIA